MSAAARWTIAVLLVVGALVAGLVAEIRKPAPTVGTAGLPGQTAPATTDPGVLAGLRERAALPPCRTGAGTGPAALRGLQVECAADGSDVDVAQMFAGRRVVLNLWAYWCLPCRAELPAMAAYQRRVGPDTLVVTVHQDDDEAAALGLRADRGVRLPTLQDGRRRVAAALHSPNVMPTTVVLGADGSVSRVLPRAFADADEIAAAVGDR